MAAARTVQLLPRRRFTWRLGVAGLLFLLAPRVYAQVTPRIVNGTLTSSYASTGALLIYEDSAQAHVTGLCSGTLVGCRTFVTAAHCVCADADDFDACTQAGVTAAGRLRVFFQHAGFVQVDRVSISPDFRFGEAGDIAVLQLAEAVTGIEPSSINSLSKPEAGTTGTIVGFGRTINAAAILSDAGVKREGKVTVSDCNRVVPNRTHVCWQYLGADSSTCSGDSGGPLFIDFGDGLRLAGVTSGGSNGTCEAPDRSFDTDVFVYSDWLSEQIDDCAAVITSPASATLLSRDGDLARTEADARFTVGTPTDAVSLRFALNGQLAATDFDLYVRADAAPTTEDYDCADLAFSSFGACEISVAGTSTWHVLVHRVAGSGNFQLNVTALIDSTPPACSGDCNGNGAVDVEDLVIGVNIVLGRNPATSCLALDRSADGTVTVEELVTGVGNALRGCVP